MLYSLQAVIFFSFLFLCLISSFIPLWSEKMIEIVSILLNLLMLILCSSMWSILENVPCTLEKNAYSVMFWCNVLKISIKSTYSIVSFGISFALLVFFLDLSIDMSRVSKAPIIIVFPSISPFFSVSICLMYLGTPILDCIHYFIIIYSHLSL